ncbi:MAG: DNA-directed RNA polymerase subunit E' [Methanosaeta sp. PtaB.Bin039]|nr:MAG: DNA-directed RNA polymerase subunit E' [Methanosaeta sp. PtaB.Bin039]HOT07654.1 DNA-directed RNA polymerase [Methanotrichaceae archaeon]HQF15926.1 DNA-directed RNA polymerase [Methanotrichaceae archaeon]HQI90726.1 DNA-directed RNA polymerase [Methanotrichaceae archaeon]HQJ27996.1 DNA-directed RNA polymerase [Methanotrichaceae archaeon]
MYKRMKLQGVVSIPPDQLGNPLKESVEIALRNKYEARVDKTLGEIVAVLGADQIGEGHILAGRGEVYYDVVFDAVAFKPEMQEVIEGEVVEIVKFGAFLSVGPFDGLLHVSQITNEYISYDEKNARLVSKDSSRYLAEGDRVRARIIAVSLNEKEPRSSKIGLTMRQTGLGKVEWLEAARKAQEAEVALVEKTSRSAGRDKKAQKAPETVTDSAGQALAEAKSAPADPEPAKASDSVEGIGEAE